MYTNVTEAFLDNLDEVIQRGRDTQVPGFEAKELLSVLIQIKEPRARTYVIPFRNNNIFSTIAETTWMLAGRNDMNFLGHYLSRARDFSDDGETWRGGYGPRIRNWHGVDQVKAVLERIRKKPDNRRSVISLYDPSRDFVESRDIPCYNWLQFLVQNDLLYLNIAARANDLIWGFSGINTFEWSVLHEMLAFWLGVSVGPTSYFIGALQCYEHHFARAHKILNVSNFVSLYEAGFSSPAFATPFDKFDILLKQWFEIEAGIRQQDKIAIDSIQQVKDPLFGICQ